MIIDGKNAILGRLATYAAKELLNGSEIIVVNSEKIVITGSPKKIVGDYLKNRRRGSPQHGPFAPKKPDLIVRRTIRGMLPKSRKGRNAFRKLKVYVDIPAAFQGKEMKSIEVKELKTNFIRVGELAQSIGWKK